MPLVLAMAAPSPRMPDTPLWDVPEEGRTLAIGQVADGPSPNMAVSGDVAQLEEHLLCKQGVAGSSPVVSTNESAGQRSMTTLGRCRARGSGREEAATDGREVTH